VSASVTGKPARALGRVSRCDLRHVHQLLPGLMREIGQSGCHGLPHDGGGQRRVGFCGAGPESQHDHEQAARSPSNLRRTCVRASGLTRDGLLLPFDGRDATYANPHRRLLYDNTMQRFEERRKRVDIIRVKDTADP
jgi:hypothetical protein